jgi:hypothetical protein
MKPNLIKSLTIKVYGSKQAIEDFKVVIDKNFISIDQDIIYNSQHGDYEEWITIYTQENET